MQVEDLISYSNAAQEIGCSRATLYRAVDDGRLRDMEVGGRRMLVKDEDWESFEPNSVGRRAQRSEQNEDTSSSSQ
ncbi:excisionase family DNA binding protein [Salinibacter ruber]|jgi:excisionase family DNA binding protein|uniref:Excisionase family DNA binding protein n=1 Tax=Salinibacter ruber TaxID=146919 RepID=A0A9X2TED2_9BACT|nr:excisionase family DNA binding protein [Salinibacter ruber]MCS3679519.1 excisionase family DNA binding protein [Salinibacter ruber]MCS4178474.1 excisionase family DNA binding protein [Salinibacter ruber]